MAILRLWGRHRCSWVLRLSLVGTVTTDASVGTKPYYSITQVPLHIWPLSLYKRPSELDTQARLSRPRGCDSRQAIVSWVCDNSYTNKSLISTVLIFTKCIIIITAWKGNDQIIIMHFVNISTVGIKASRGRPLIIWGRSWRKFKNIVGKKTFRNTHAI